MLSTTWKFKIDLLFLVNQWRRYSGLSTKKIKKLSNVEFYIYINKISIQNKISEKKIFMNKM